MNFDQALMGAQRDPLYCITTVVDGMPEVTVDLHEVAR
jgi:hypothetical protein